MWRTIAATTSQNGSYVPTYVMNFGQDPTFNGNIDTEGQAPENGIGRFYFEPPAGYQALVKTTLLPCQGDSDCDGVLTGDDCDDDDVAYGDILNDADCDLVLNTDAGGDDCDDSSDDYGSQALDVDCDGVLTEDDCDDNDENSTTLATDADCDTVLTADDCDDTNATSTTLATDVDCDSVLTADDCDDNDASSTTVATDGDCDGVITADDCDDNDPALWGISQDADCDGTQTARRPVRCELGATEQRRGPHQDDERQGVRGCDLRSGGNAGTASGCPGLLSSRARGIRSRGAALCRDDDG